MLKSIWNFARKLFGSIRMTPIRLNLLVIAAGIFIIALGILNLIPQLLKDDSVHIPLIVGTLLGLLGGCIAGLSQLGTTLMNDDGKRKDE